MANIKSAKKRILVNDKKRDQNKVLVSELKTEIKKFKALAETDEAKAKEYLDVVFKKIDCAASKNLIHKNNASRKKAALAKMLNKKEEK